MNGRIVAMPPCVGLGGSRTSGGGTVTCRLCAGLVASDTSASSRPRLVTETGTTHGCVAGEEAVECWFARYDSGVVRQTLATTLTAPRVAALGVQPLSGAQVVVANPEASEQWVTDLGGGRSSCRWCGRCERSSYKVTRLRGYTGRDDFWFCHVTL